MNMKKLNVTFALLVAAVMLAPSLHAANGTWTVDANGLWSTSSNWASSIIADGSGSTANFTNDITTDRTVSLDADRTLTSLVFGDGATVTAGSWILNNNGVAANNLILAGTTPGITVNALGTGKTATISAIIEGTAGLVKSGTGTLVLSGANTYTGATTINAGTLTASGGNAIANTGAVIVNSGSVFNLFNNETIGSIAGAGTVSLGTATAGAGGTLDTGGDGTSTTFSGVISGTGRGLTKSGAGTLTLTGANTYNGTMTINAGTVKVTGTGKVGLDTANITLANVAGATLDFTGVSSSRIHGNLSGGGASGGNIVLGAGTMYVGNGASSYTYGGIISGTGNFSYAGTGTQTLTGNNTFDGKTGVSKGTLSISSISSINGGASSVGNATTAATGRLDIGDKTDTGTLLYTGTGHSTDRSVNLGGYTGGATLDASGSGALVFTSAFQASVVGTKTLTLTGNNTADNRIGGAIVNNATTGSTATTAASSASTALVLASVDGLTVGNAISGSGITGGTTISAINTDTKTVTLSAAATVLNAATITSTGLVNRTSLTKAGTGKWVLSGANTYTGATTVSAGTLLVDTGASIASSASIVNGGLLTVKGTAGNVTVNGGGSLGGSGTVGALTLNNGGLLNPGNSPGILTASSAIILGGATYNWQISALQGTAGTNWDLLSVTGLLDMTGVTSSSKWNLVVTGDSGFAGWTDTSSYSYAFAQAANLSLSAEFSSAVGTDVTSLFNITALNITSLPNATHNPNGDFKVVVGSANGLATLNLMTIPEPSSASLVALAGTALLVLRRRRNS